MYSRTIPLFKPLQTSAGVFREVVVNTITAKQTRCIREKYDLDHDLESMALMDYTFDLVQAMTGLSEAELSLLSTPDYNTIQDEVDNLSSLTSEALLKADFARRRQAGEKAKAPEFSLDNPTLLVPVEDEIKGKITDYRLLPPTVGLTRKLRSEKDKHKRGMAISSQCTGLHPDIIDQFHMPDFNYLMEKMKDFLTEGSAFFPKQTSTD
jgi:hypothetical protein